MIDTDKYEGHTSDWKWIDINEQDDFYLHSEHGDIINHDTPDGKLAQDAPLLLAEVIRLREELDTIKSSTAYKYRSSPSAFGAAIETHVLLQDEWHEHYTDEAYNELKKLTEDEYYRFCAACGEEDGFWSDDATQDYAEEMHIRFIEANVKNLKAEGGVEGLRKRWREEDGEEK